MIFSVPGHIEMIIDGTKTQTRRKSPFYKVGRTYSIQPGRTEKGIKEGRILVTRKRVERYLDGGISIADALAEGKYTPGQFETLFSNMYHDWIARYAYTFVYLEREQFRSMKL